MEDPGGSSALLTRRIRWTARIWSLAVIAIAVIVFVGHLGGEDPREVDHPPAENLIPITLCLSVLGLALAWRWEGLGGIVNVGFFAANLSVYSVLHGELLELGVIGILSPIVLPGILFLVCWWRSRGEWSAQGGS